jgi:hypothetical protein
MYPHDISANLRLTSLRILSEIGYLLTTRAKYEPNGEFDPNWYVFQIQLPHFRSDVPFTIHRRGPETGIQPVYAAPVPPETAVIVTEEPISSKPAWRAVPPKKKAKRDRQAEAMASAAPPLPPPVIEQHPPSWVSWKRKPAPI